MLIISKFSGNDLVSCGSYFRKAQCQFCLCLWLNFTLLDWNFQFLIYNNLCSCVSSCSSKCPRFHQIITRLVINNAENHSGSPRPTRWEWSYHKLLCADITPGIPTIRNLNGQRKRVQHRRSGALLHVQSECCCCQRSWYWTLWECLKPCSHNART